MGARTNTYRSSAQLLPLASKSLTLSLDVFHQDCGKSRSPHFLFLLWVHRDQKGEFRAEARARPLFDLLPTWVFLFLDSETLGNISGNISLSLRVSVEQLLTRSCHITRPGTDAKTAIAATASSSRLPSLLQIARIRRQLWFIRKKEFVVWRVLTPYQEKNGAAALLVGLWHGNSTDWHIFPSCIWWKAWL